MSMEVRRVQRLGSSSLVITLPKEWTRRLGIKPGDQILLYDEGSELRISPLEKKVDSGVYLDLTRIEPQLASYIITCIYLSGFDTATVKMPRTGSDLVEELRFRSQRFMGAEVYKVGNGEIKVDILLDMNKVDLSRLFKIMSNNISKITRILINKFQNRESPDDIKQAEFLRSDFMGTLYLAMRYIGSRRLAEPGKTGSSLLSIQTAIVSNYMGFLVDLLYDILVELNEAIYKTSGNEKKQIVAVLKGIEEAGSLTLRLIASPSTKRITELHGIVEDIDKRLKNLVKHVETPAGGILLGRLQDTARLLLIIKNVITCRTILYIATNHKE